MGAQQSTANKREHVNLTDLSDKVISSLKSECGSTVQANVEFIVRGQRATEFNFSGNQISQDLSIDAKCLNKNINKSNIKTKVEENIKKKIDNVTSGGAAPSENISIDKNITDLSTEFANIFMSSCNNNFSANINITIEENDIDGPINITNNSIDQELTAVSECINNNEILQDLTKDLNKKVKEHIKNHNIGVFNSTNILYSVICCVVLIIVAGLIGYAAM